MNDEQQKAFRTYAWGYFVQHAEQRLKTFNFYVVFCTVLIGAFATLVSKNGLTWHFSVLPLLLPIFSFVFWKLDIRTKILIGVAEEAIKYLDGLALKDASPEARVLALFERDEEQTSCLKKYPLIDGYFSYSRVFNWVFAVMAIFGIMGVVICLRS